MEERGCVYKIAKNEVYGRYLITNKSIKQGQLILKESPIILCSQLGSPIICFNCCNQLKKVNFCSNCAIAVLCNQQCKGQFHSIQECDVFKTIPIKREDILTNPEIITPLRCLLWRQYIPDLYRDFLQLESHLDARRNSQIWRRNHVNIEKVLEKFKIIENCDLKDEIVQKICGIIDINTFDVRQPQRNTGGENLRGLYLTAALMAHDCIANTHLAIDDDFFLYIHAAVDIPENDPIFFNYINALQGNCERLRQLSESKHFECTCSRCSDCTELGTEMSSLKCPKCRKGLIRPNPWQCSSCKRIYNSSLIKMTVTECQRKIDEFETPDPETLEKFVQKLTLTFHPHHYLILQIEQNLIHLYTNRKNLNRKIELCNKLLAIFQRIEPGISRMQAIVMYELHSALVDLAQKCYKTKEIDQKEFLKRLSFAENTLKASIKYLLYEPPNSPEGRLAQNALSELKLLRQSINNLQKEMKRQK